MPSTPSSFPASSSRVSGRDLGDLPDPVLVPEQGQHLRVEDLPRELVRLVEDDLAVAGVGVVPEVRSLVDESPPVRVHHDAERVAVLLEVVPDREVPEGRGVPVPPHRVAARPVAVRHRPRLEGHPDPVAGVVAGPPHLGEVPTRAEVAGAPFRVRLEPPAGEDHRPRPEPEPLPAPARHHPAHPLVFLDEVRRPGTVEDGDVVVAGRLGEGLDEPRPAAPHLDREAPPESVSVRPP